MNTIRIALIDQSYFPVYQEAFAGVQRELAGERDVQILLCKNRGTLEETLQGFEGHGVLGSMIFPDTQEVLGKKNLKAVSILRAGSYRPYVTTDHVGNGARVAEHFIERGHRRVGYFSAGDQQYSALYAEGIEKVCQVEEIDFSIFTIGKRTKKRGTWCMEDQRADFLDWLLDTAPTCLATADEEHARRAVENCNQAGIRIPEDLSICSCLGNPLTCDFYDPPLSSIHSDMPSIGAHAFRLLVSWIRNSGDILQRELILEDGELRVRRSSDIHAIKDPAIQKVLTYLDHSLEENPSVSDLTNVSGMSRRTLERRFEDKLGYSPAVAIRRAKENLAKNLLMYSDIPFQEIAFRCGMQHASQLSRLTQETYGKTPTQLRSHKN